MYQCNKCNARFDTPDKTTIIHYEVDTSQKETISICPVCGSDNFEEVTICPGCSYHYIKSNEDYCNECYQDVSRAVDELANWKQLSREEIIDLINSYLEV
jgi:predicted amidophosphoribosyltransferase